MSNEIYQAGAAREDITPPTGILLFGYTVREGFSRGVDEPLTTTALVIDGMDGRVALIAIDWGMAFVPFTQSIRESCAKALDVSVANVLINFSHSHSTPPPPDWMPYAEPEQAKMQTDWAERTREASVRACQRAAGAIQPARITNGWGECHANINRRQLTSDGSVLLGEDGEAPSDHSVGVLRVDDLQGCPLAVAFRFSCHTVTLGPRTNVISPDFVGAARGVVEGGLKCLSLFLQGCAGNQNPITGIGQDVEGREDTERIGHMLGAEVLKIAATLRTHRRRCEPRLIHSVAAYWLFEYETILPGPQGRVNASEVAMTLPLVPFPDIPEIEKEVYEWHRRRDEALAREALESERNVNQRFTFWAEQRLAAAKAGPNPRPVTFSVQIIRIGPVVVVGLPFETMSETGTDLRAASPVPDTWVLGYCNGVISYLPTPKISAEGGMEARLGYKNYLLPSEIPGDWEPKIQETVLKQIRSES